jgi:hypothetical protein
MGNSEWSTTNILCKPVLIIPNYNQRIKIMELFTIDDSPFTTHFFLEFE